MGAAHRRSSDQPIDIREEWRLIAVASAEAALDCLREERIEMAGAHIARAKRCIERLTAT